MRDLAAALDRVDLLRERVEPGVQRDHREDLHLGFGQVFEAERVLQGPEAFIDHHRSADVGIDGARGEGLGFHGHSVPPLSKRRALLPCTVSEWMDSMASSSPGVATSAFSSCWRNAPAMAGQFTRVESSFLRKVRRPSTPEASPRMARIALLTVPSVSSAAFAASRA